MANKAGEKPEIKWYKVSVSKNDPESKKVERLISVDVKGIHICEKKGDGQLEPKRDILWSDMKEIAYKNNVFRINLKIELVIFCTAESTKTSREFFKRCKAAHQSYLRGRASSMSDEELDEIEEDEYEVYDMLPVSTGEKVDMQSIGTGEKVEDMPEESDKEKYIYLFTRK